MDKRQNLELIADISNANGAPGFEDDVVAQIRRHAEGLGELREDSLRNLYIYRKENKGNRPVVQLDGHSDEVAFMVQAIRPDGNLRIIPLGGWVTSNVPAHKVWVRNALGEYIPGIVASKPPHYMTEAERKAPLVFENITVDVGAVSKEEAENEFHIRIGEPVVPDVTFTYDEKHDLMVGKSFDCRLGCASIVSTLRELQGKELAVDVVGACCSQEEVGTRGSQVTCRTVNPDLAIVFEGCPGACRGTWHSGTGCGSLRRKHQRRQHSPVRPGRSHHRYRCSGSLCTHPLRNLCLRRLRKRCEAGCGNY